MQKQRSQRPRRSSKHKSQSLRVSLADRVGAIHLSQPSSNKHHPSLMPLPSRSAKDVLAVLMATTGLALAGKENSKIERLPGTPTIVLITNGDKPAAAFLLPISETEACKAFGQPVPQHRDHLLEHLYQEERQAELDAPDVILDQKRAHAWGLEDSHAC